MIKPLIRKLVVKGWSAAFNLWGALHNPEPAVWASDTFQRVMVIAPHPDDEAIGCAGTILRHRKKGDEVCLVYVTDGRRSRSMGFDQLEMSRVRRHEAVSCAAQLKTGCFHWLGLKEGDWAVEEFMNTLVPIMEHYSPQVLYAPSRVDFHYEHHNVAFGLAKILADPTINLTVQTLRVYQIHVPLTILLTNLISPIGSVARSAHRALQVYASQKQSVEQGRRLSTYAGHYYRMASQVEEFWTLSPKAYLAVHPLNEFPWPKNLFRGIRSHPISDPFAYLVGRPARRQLALLSGDILTR